MKRRISRETADAFGDAPDRDVEAEFGALAKVTVNAPKVSVQAPKLSTAGLVAPTAAQKAQSAAFVAAGAKAVASGAIQSNVSKATPVKPAPPKPVATAPIKLPAPAKASVATTAQTGNFIEATGKALAAPVVKAPALTAAQQAAKDKALAVVAQTRVQQAAQATSAANAAYKAKRAADLKYEQDEAKRLQADPGPEGQRYRAQNKFISSAGIDTGQITMGAKVLAVGAAVIASGGAVAGGIGLTAGGASLASAAAADRLLSAVEKGGDIAKQATSVINDAKAAAAKGDAIAKQAVATVETVAKERIAKAVPKGVEQALTGAAKAAANQVVDKLTGAGGASLSLSSAANGSPLPSSAYALSAPILTSRKDVKASGSSASAAAARLLEAPRPVWLVSEAGKVVDLTSTPSAASGRGYVVFSTGKVVHQ